MNFSYAANNVLINGGTGVINQSFQVWADSLYNPSPPAAPDNFRTLTVFINAVDAGNSLLSQLAVTDPTQTDPMVPAKLGTAFTTRRRLLRFRTGVYHAASGPLHPACERGRPAAGSKHVHARRPLAARVQRDGRQRVDIAGDGPAFDVLRELPVHRADDLPAVTSPGLGANGLPLLPAHGDG